MPPRLLTGISLLFWGSMTGHATLGLIAALLVEAKSWVTLRWNFDKTTYVRAWHYTILCGAIVAILAWMNGMKVGKLHTLFVWVPLILLPIELAMRYGRADKIPLNTFSFFARKKMVQDLKHGRYVQPRMINTGYAYTAVVLLATAMGSRHETYHFAGLSILLSTALFMNGRKTGFRPIAWCSSILLVLILSLVSQWGINKLYDYYQGGERDGTPGRDISANETRTSIGRLGRLKLSPQIFWRMKVDNGNTPALLRVATYNRYSRANWKYTLNPENINDERDIEGYIIADDASTEDFDIRIFKKAGDKEAANPANFPETANVRIIGEVNAKIRENPIPIPHFTQAIGNIGQLGIEASVESNPLGTVRLANPDFSVIEYKVWTGDHSTTEDKYNDDDLAIPPQEQEAIRRVCKQLQLNEPGITTRQKIKRLNHFFVSQFTYSTHLITPGLSSSQRKTAVGSFLETTRSGHCEYFATATALLLREAQVPTRYCVGFSVNEHDEGRGEWVMRGKHAHAWCRVWIADKNGGHWEDLDLTPPSWTSIDKTDSSLWQRQLADWWQRLREDFLLWRTHETNQTRVIWGVSLTITLFTLWIIWRLWTSRQTHHQTKKNHYIRPNNTPSTPLNKLESRIERAWGPRPTGKPLTQWIIETPILKDSQIKYIHRLCLLHNVARFDPKGISPEETDELAELCLTFKKELKSFKSS